MTIKIEEKLPNPDESDPQGMAFDEYIKRTGIKTCNDSVLLHYQNVDTSISAYVDSHELNHCLTHIAHKKNNDYTQLAETMFGTDFDIKDYQKSLQEMEDIFDNGGYSFSADSRVYKGVRTSFPYYEILDLQKSNIGETIIFPGYLSTTVSTKKVKDFTSKDGILLIISGLENAHCIVPENRAILSTKDSSTPEQELLLNKETALKVIDKNTSKSVTEIQCRVVNQG